jgi:hypothetical protein
MTVPHSYLKKCFDHLKVSPIFGRHLEELYKVMAKLFPGLEKGQFESLKNEFYANQPIILTQPFKKGW